MLLYDIHNPTRKTRIFFDGISNPQKMIRVDPGETICSIALGASAVHLIQTRQHHIKLAFTSGVPQEPIVVPTPPASLRPQPKTRPSRQVPPPVLSALLHVLVRYATPDEVAIVIGSAEGVWGEWQKA